MHTSEQRTITINNSTDKSHRSVVSLLLDSEILKHFEYEGMYELCDIKTREEYYKVNLKEKSKKPFGIENTELDFMGYLSAISVQDIPIRNRSVILNLSLKGWSSAQNKKDLIISEYPFFTKDLIFTNRLFEKFKLDL